MAELRPFEIFGFNDTEANIYNLLIQLSKSSRTKKSVKYRKIKAVDLIELSNYSKPKVYSVIKKFEGLGLVRIDDSRPMFITPLDPKIVFKRLIDDKKQLIDDAGSLLINQITNLPAKEPTFPLSETSPISFFSGLDKYFMRTKYLLDRAEEKIILICGFLIRNEEELLKEYLERKLKQNVEIKLLYGGAFSDLIKKESERFRTHFKRIVIEPIKSVIEQYKNKFTVDGLNLAPPFRITLIDDSELILVLKAYEEKDIRMDITKISGVQTDNPDFIRFVSDTSIMLKSFFVDKLKKFGFEIT